MIHREINTEPSGFVPTQPLLPGETLQPVKTGNGHTIESLRSMKTFNRSCGCELDRLSMASSELRNIINSEHGKSARSYARTLSNLKK